MRIALVETAGKGGLAHYAFQMARGLAEVGADVTLVTASPWELAERPRPFRVVPLLRLWDPKPAGPAPGPARRRLRRAARAVRYYREWIRLVRHLARERYDLVVFGDVRFPTDGLPLALLRLLGVRLADVCHNVFPFGATGSVRRSRLLRAAYALVYRQFEIVFVHFAVNRRDFQAAYGLPESRVVVIPHGDEELFREQADPAVTPGELRARLGIDASAQVVLLLGTLSRYKGADVAIRALPALRRRAPRARLVLAGHPAPDFDVDGHHRLARELGVADMVTIAPAYVPTGEVAAFLQLASAAVFPYRTVFQSGALQVALTFGRPLVATTVGAMPEVVEHGRNGLLVPPGDADALAAALAALLDDPSLAGRLGDAAAADARTRFSWTAIARTLLAAAERTRGGGAVPRVAPEGAA